MSVIHSLKFYDIKARLSAGVLGESYVVTAVDYDEKNLAQPVEWAVFMSRPTDRMVSRLLKVAGTSAVPKEVGPWGLEEMHEEAARQAQLSLLDVLDARAQELNRPNLADTPVQLVELRHRPLVGAWMRGKWTKDMERMTSDAGTEALQRFFTLLARVKRFEQPRPI